MTGLSVLPPWAALLVATLALAGATVSFIGALGLLRLDNFYRRMHAPTLGTTLGMTLMALASVACHSLSRGEIHLAAILIVPFITITTPITMLLLTRAALMRNRAEGTEPGAPDPRHHN